MKTQPVNVLLLLSAFIILFSACSQEDEVTYQLNSKLVELKCGNTFALEVSPTSSALTYTSLNTNIATVTSSGVVKAGLVGTTKVVVKDEKAGFVDTVKVVVSTIHTLFQDPYFGFGANQMTVEENMSLPLTLVNDRGDGVYTLNFRDYSSYVNWWLYYMNKEGIFTHVELLISSLFSDDLDAHVADRYMYMVSKVYAEDQYNFDFSKFCINPDSSLLVIVYPNNDSEIISIVYYPANKAVIEEVLTNDTVAFYK